MLIRKLTDTYFLSFRVGLHCTILGYPGMIPLDAASGITPGYPRLTLHMLNKNVILTNYNVRSRLGF